MDPDLVRLILILLGVLLVVGIYLWDRYKRAAPRMRPARRPRVEPRPADDTVPTGAPAAMAPAADDEAQATAPAMDAPVETPTTEKDGRRRGTALDPEPGDIGEWSALSSENDPQLSMELNFDAHGDGDYLSTDPALYDEVERKIVVVNLAAGNGHFPGPAIVAACADVGLVLGDMSIFHCRDEATDRVLFSMASMVEPGIFPEDAQEAFETPGLSLFTQLPGPRDGVEIYDRMLDTAKHLAEKLGAELQDERHNKLTRQMEEHTRETIIEHRHKVRLARSRH